MRKIITMALLCCFSTSVFFAQKKRNCHAMENLEYRKNLDPALKQRMDAIERFTQEKLKRLSKSNPTGRIVGDIITIPVVVHILYTNSSNNISDAQINSQIDVLNADFRRTNSDATNKWSQAADTQIEFRLASIDPNGNSTTGITRTQVSTSTWGTNDQMKSASSGGVNPWNTAEYLNMWIVDNITSGGNTILGYAQFPGGSAATDGVVMADQYFGTTGTAQAPFDGGRTTTHEVGHYLNLRHIWGDGACGVDDFVSDTPTSDAPNYGCATGHTSCGTEDMVQNYMDYSDDSCMNLFTQGQKNRMRAVLEAGGSRRALALSDKFSDPCTLGAPNNVTASSINDNGFTVSWNSVSGAVSYDVTVGGTTVNVSGTSYNATGLTSGTQYSVSVAAKCNTGGNGSSASINVTTTGTAPLNYCASNGNNVSDEYISRVQLGSIDNATGAAASGYADFSSISTNLQKGQAATVTVTPTWTGTLYNEGYAVFIDYNKDGDFTDSGETVWTQSATQTSPVSGSFTVPNSAVTGTTRMRVVMQYNAVPSSCGSYNYGETEDYTVNLTSAVADTTAPVITLNGNATVNVSFGSSFTDPGATASDNVDGNLTSSIVVTGSVNTNQVGTYTLSYNVSDAAGNAATEVTRTVNVNDTTAPVISLNGSSTINLNVGDNFTDPGATASDNVDGNLTSSIVITGSVNTNVAGAYTLNYNVSDAAGNAATEVSRTVNVNEVSSGGCSGGISSFPYSEGFENTLGAWTQSSADDINWTVDANGTPSNGTGPSSATQGSYYVYVEASGNNTGYPNKRAILNSPCFDLSGETAATFSFAYHMYGSNNMGSIALEASNDDGATWTSIWSETGNKGNSWQTASVDLGSYVGGSVQLRFNRLTGSTWQADIAVDDVQLIAGNTPPPSTTTVNLSITFDNYPEETSWEIQDSTNAVVASGGTYASQPDGSTLNIAVELAAGCYTLVMKDTYGDGICCTYGNGSYTLSDGSTTLASGASFASSDTSSFCVGGASNARTSGLSNSISEDFTSFKVFPNPVSTNLNISLIGLQAQTFQVINALGQTVKSGAFTKNVDVSNLKQGIYILKVNIGDKHKITRFVKQ